MVGPHQRNSEDVAAAASMGIAATRIDERLLATQHELTSTPIHFEPNEALNYGGVLLLLPFLLAAGLLSYQKHYRPLSPGYYDLNTIILTIALLYLCRIKNIEQTKHISPGEFGKLLGLDRIASQNKLREKLQQIVSQRQSQTWNRALAKEWVQTDDNTIYYVDGHVQVYSGSQANLGKKHVAQSKLCMPGTIEYWVNNSEGMPYFVVTGEVNEKLLEMLDKTIIEEIKTHIALPITDHDLNNDPDLPRFTLTFDREGYCPERFQNWWNDHRVAVLTYRKNVTDKWNEQDFTPQEVDMHGNKTTMFLAEKTVELNKVSVREIRKLSQDGHQTSVITTNKKLALKTVALKMFARWSQENFFRYLLQEYDLDHIVQYKVNQVNEETKVVNPAYSKVTNRLKKLREKINRRKAQLYQLVHQNISEDADKTESNLKKQIIVRAELKEFENQEKQLLEERNGYSYKIKVKEMSEATKYSKLDTESKLFQNIIKMICYRAETNFATLLAIDYKKKVNELRALAKSVIFAPANIRPDETNKRLIVELYTLSVPRDNAAVQQIMHILNDSKTIFPGTDLTLFYKFATI